MKFEEQKIFVRLGEKDSADEAVITFLEPLETERIQLQQLYKDKDILGVKGIVRKNCVDVQNLFNPEGIAIDVASIKAGNLRGSYADAIFIGYMQAILPQDTKEDTEKNA